MSRKPSRSRSTRSIHLRFESLEDRTTPTGSPAIRSGYSVAGPSFSDNNPTIAAPASPAVAVGKANYVTVTNADIQIGALPATGGTKQTLNAFFGALSPASNTIWVSPRATYDQYADRYIVSVIANKPSSTFSNVYLAVSSSGDPTASWHFAAVNTDIQIPSGTDTAAGYLGLAVDATAVYFTTSQFDGGGNYADVRLFIIDKTGGAGGGFYGGGSLSVNGPLDPSPAGQEAKYFGLVPAQMYDTPTAPGSSVGTYLVAYNGSSSGVGSNESVEVVRVDNPLSSPTFTPVAIDVGDIDNTAMALNAPQPNSSSDGFTIDPGSRRAGNAVWRDNRLYFAATVNSPSGAEAGQDAAHWFQIKTTDNSVDQQGDIGGEASSAGLYTYDPSVAVDALGDLAVSFDGSNNSVGPSAYYAARTANDPVDTMRDPIKLLDGGSNEYVRHLLDSAGNPTGPNAWGPYSAIVIAADDRSFWTFNSAATSTSGTAPEVGRWVTEFGGFSFNWPPDIALKIPNQTATEDQAPLNLNLNTYFNDLETPVASLVYTVVGNTNPAMVSTSISSQQLLTLTLAPNGNGSAFITVQATDGGTADAAPASTTQTFLLTVTPVNDPPVAFPDSYSTNEDTTLNADNNPIQGVLANDTDPDVGDVIAAVLDTGPSFASNFSMLADGTFTYTPLPNFNGSDSFTYHDKDLAGAISDPPVTVSITVNPVNDPPVAVNDSYSLAEDTQLNPATPSVLANDTDVDNTNGQLTAVLVTGPSHAQSFTLNPDGTFSYKPVADFPFSTSAKTDTFTYKAFDGTDLSATAATVTITVTPVDDAPRPADDTYHVSEDATLTVNAPGVLGNDVEVDGETLTITANTTTSNGVLNFNQADGSFTYTPNAHYDGPDSFTYTVTDGHTEVTANVNIIVDPVDDSPVAVADSYATNEDTQLNVAAPGVLANDSDIDSPVITAQLVSGPAHATTFNLNADGSFSYLPALNYNGTDSFTYQAFDGNSLSNPVTVTLKIYPVEDPVVAHDDSATTSGQPVKINVLANDVDPDNDTLQVQSYTHPTQGSVARLGSQLVYTPIKGASGADSFTYVVSDGHGSTDTATVNITITDTVAPTVKSVLLHYGTVGDHYVDLGSLSRSILPWANITQVSIVFSENIQSVPLGTALTLKGIGGNLGMTYGGFDTTSHTATWTLNAPIGIDRITLSLAAGDVLDTSGNAMKSNWARTFSVLPGDYNGDGIVNDTDLKAIKKKLGKIDKFADIDGTGIVTQTDLDTATSNKGKKHR